VTTGPPRRSIREAVRATSLALPAALFVLLPLLALAVTSPWSRAIGTFRRSGALTAALVSVKVTAEATVLAFLVGFPAAWALARLRLRARNLVRAVVIMPIVLPPVVAGVALLTALGRLGFVGRALGAIGVRLPFTTTGAAVAAAFVSFPFLVLGAEAGLRRMGTGLDEAAAALGASAWYRFRRVTMPLLRPELGAALLLTWARALGEFGATITFAGNLKGTTQTLPLAVFQALQVDPGGAQLISLIMVAVSVVVLAMAGSRLLGR
jgi:molybdate transport system permease protein